MTAQASFDTGVALGGLVVLLAQSSIQGHRVGLPGVPSLCSSVQFSSLRL